MGIGNKSQQKKGRRGDTKYDPLLPERTPSRASISCQSRGGTVSARRTHHLAHASGRAVESREGESETESAEERERERERERGRKRLDEGESTAKETERGLREREKANWTKATRI